MKEEFHCTVPVKTDCERAVVLIRFVVPSLARALVLESTLRHSADDIIGKYCRSHWFYLTAAKERERDPEDPRVRGGEGETRQRERLVREQPAWPPTC